VCECVCVCVCVYKCVCVCVRACVRARARVCLYLHMCVYVFAGKYTQLYLLFYFEYGVATISRLVKIISLFCRISSLLYGSFGKETYNLRSLSTVATPQ